MLEPGADSALIRRYYLYRATVSVGFIAPVFTLFILRSLTFTQFGILSAIYSVLSVAGEVPTGYVGDRLGRRASLLLSVVFTVASLAGFVVAEGFRWYAFLYALWALALTFRSGSADAWLYDALDERLDTGTFSSVRGRGDAVQQWTGAVTMIGGGLLYGLDPTYPFVAAVAFNSLGVLVLLSMPKNRRYAGHGPDASASGGSASGGGEPGRGDADADDGGDRLGPLEAVPVIRDHLARPPLRSLVLYVGLFYAVVSVAQGYVQPMAVETLGPLAASAGIDLPRGGAVAAARSGEAGPALAVGLGVLYAGLTAVSSFGGYYAGAVERRLGVRRAVFLVPLVTAVAFVAPFGVALLALPAFAVMRTAMPLVQPIATGYVNDRVGSVGRATLLSAVSMFYMALRTPLALAAGAAADAATATASVAALGGLFLAVGGAVWVLGDVAPDVEADDGTVVEDESAVS